MSIEELLEVARGEAVELGPPALDRIAAGRAVVEAALAGGDPVYGLNTDLGHNKDVRLPEDDLRRLQEVTLAAHAGGVGPPLTTELVRAAIAVRVNGIARGGSGASVPAVRTLVNMLNRGVHPVVASRGSVGAGDLGQMADIALVAIGRGRAEYDAEIVDGGTALARAGIEPHVLRPKDGLALMSANGVSIAHGGFVVERAERFADLADRAAVLSLEAIGGNPSIVHPAVSAAKPFGGQLEASLHIASLLEGSLLLEEERPSVQDALSFRVVPQVHGALREFLTVARDAVEVELNARSDNPLVSVEDGAMIHNGNFHPAVMALAFDALRVAVTHTAQLSERRMSHLWDATFAHPSFASAQADQGTRSLVGLSLRYPGAALFAEVKGLAQPATLDIPPLDFGVEDHATGAPLTVRATERALDLAEDVAVVEMLMARGLVVMGDARPSLGKGAAALVESIDAALAELPPDVSAADAHAHVRNRLR